VIREAEPRSGKLLRRLADIARRLQTTPPVPVSQQD